MARMQTIVLAAIACWALNAAEAKAQTPPGEKKQEATSAGPSSSAGKPALQLSRANEIYSGVTLLGGEPPPTQPPPPGYQNITWIGFRAGDGASRIFLQLTGLVSYQVKTKGKKISVLLDKVKVPRRNNLRPIITKKFPGTSVLMFRLRPQRRGKVQLSIQLRQRAKPTVDTKTVGPFTYLVVAFPEQAAVMDEADTPQEDPLPEDDGE